MIRQNMLLHPWLKTAATLLALAGASMWEPSAHAQSLLYGIGGTDTGAGPDAAAYTLFTFSSASPGATTTVGTVTPSSGFVLQSIAFQPSTGNLFGFQFNGGNGTGQLVTINRASATLTPLGSAFTIGSISGTSGDTAAISFNPGNGVVRLVTGTAGNYRIDAATGAVIGQDTSVDYPAGDPDQGSSQIASLGYDNGANLYDLDYVHGSLATQNDTTGMLSTVGSLGVTPTQGASSVGFTIGLGNAAFFNSTVDTDGDSVRDHLYSVDLTDGAATDLGLIGSVDDFNTVDVAAFVPEPGAYVFCAAGAIFLGCVVARRRTVLG